MDLYEQEPEVEFLTELLPFLRSRAMIDVGAERGSFSVAMLEAGVERVDAIEPDSRNAATLRARFAADARVTVHQHAAGDNDGAARLHLASDPSGASLPFGHSLLDRADTKQIAWRTTEDIELKSLRSLVLTGAVPTRVGILKVDTEGNDLAVVRGMGSLDADVVMVEHWRDLPEGLGECPWTTTEMVSTLRCRGFTHFAFIVHRGEFKTMKWNDGDIETGAMGNLVFMRDELLARSASVLLGLASRFTERAVAIGTPYVTAAVERMTVIDELKAVADERLIALERVSSELAACSLELRKSKVFKAVDMVHTSPSPRPADIFLSPHYLRHNQRRQEHLASLGLPLSHRSVLEVGAGIGDHTSFFLDRDCDVITTEAQEQNLTMLRERYPQLDVRKLDLNSPPEPIEVDVVYCYGTLYHLQLPSPAIAWMARCTRSMLLLETCVSAAEGDELYTFDERVGDPDNAVDGHGCRPTRAWIHRELTERFEHVYMPLTQPSHEEFPIDWSLPELRSRTLVRAIYVASREPLENELLTESIPQLQGQA